MNFLKNIRDWIFDTIIHRSMLGYINSTEINTENLDDPKGIFNIEDIEKAKEKLLIAKRKSFNALEIMSPNAIYNRKKFINDYEYLLGKRELEILKTKLDIVG
jgi:hypothetical protein